MQRRTQQDRTDTTRNALITAARALFVAQGYAATGTPEIVAAAGITRGALYHHFADKAALFAAVAEAEAQAVSATIHSTGDSGEGPLVALIRGGEAFLDAMTEPGRVRLLLTEAPAVLGPQAVAALDEGTGAATLAQGLRAAMDAGIIPDGPVEPLAACLSAAYDRAALAIAGGANAEAWEDALARLVTGLAARPPAAP